MTSLNSYGWNSFHQNNYITFKDKDQLPGRLISIKGFKYYLITERGELETELAGKLLYGVESQDLPKVGDWVCYLDYGQMGYIIQVLPRVNALSRKNPGNKIEKQILAANIEYAFIVQGLDRDFNIMRLERYLTQVVNCGIVPVVILNKVDLISDLNYYREEVAKLKRDCKVLFCSTLTGAGMEDLRKELEEKKTYILIGSSGVGKSSLMNIFMNTTIQKTNSTSDANSKGKHTTTTRDLFQLPNGSLLIDSPGMREFGITAEEQSSEALFPMIEAFARLCRYTDCKHVNELGCGVLEAVQQGQLDSEVYESYLKLIKEQKRFEIKIEDKKRIEKQFGKLTREAKNYRKKFKY